MKAGKADLICGLNKNKVREKYMIFLDVALAKSKKAFFSVPGKRPILKYSDLLNKKNAVLRGAICFNRFDHDKRLMKYECNTYKLAIRMVESNRIDVVIMPEMEADYLLNHFGMKLLKSPMIVSEGFSYIAAMSKKSNKLKYKPVIESALLEIIGDGKMKDIFS